MKKFLAIFAFMTLNLSANSINYDVKEISKDHFVFKIENDFFNKIQNISNFALQISKQRSIIFKKKHLTKNKNGTISIKAINEKDDAVLFLVLLDNVLRGNLKIKNDEYSIVPLEKNQYKIFKAKALNRVAEPIVSLNATTYNLNPQPLITPKDQILELNVLALYTEWFYNQNNKKPELRLQQLFDIANETLKNSKLNIHLNLIPYKFDKRYGETKITQESLYKMSNDSEILALKEQHKAHFVTLFRVYNDKVHPPCGQALLPNDLSHFMPFSIINDKPDMQANGGVCVEVSFIHELGHNFGCDHDIDTINNDKRTPQGLYADSLGYMDPNRDYGTVMSYSRQNRLRYFSSDTNKDDKGRILGNANTNCTRTINITKDYIASQFEPKVPVSVKVSLKKGWNLIALEKEMEVSTKTIDPRIKIIKTYENGKYLTKSDQKNEINTLKHSYGYFVKVEEDMVVNFDGIKIKTPNQNISSWQLTGGAKILNINEFLKNNPDIKIIYKYENGSYKAVSSDVQVNQDLKEANILSFDSIKPNEGFFIKREI